jgi:hypothetical protein
LAVLVPMRAISSGGEGKEKSMARQRKTPPGVDPKLLTKDAAKLLPEPSRRLFLRGAASLGALAVLSGCDIVDGETWSMPSASFRRSTTASRRCCPQHACAGISGKHDYPASAGTRVLDFGGEISERCRLDRWFHPDGDGLGLFTSSPATIQHLLAFGSPSKAPLVVPPYVIVM